MSRFNKYFFDVHVHAFNLSHASLLAFLNRALLNKSVSISDLLNGRLGKILKNSFSFKIKIFVLLLLISLLSLPALLHLLIPEMRIMYSVVAAATLVAILIITMVFLAENAVRSKSRALINTLSVFENDLGRQIRYLELDCLSLDKTIRRNVENLDDEMADSNMNTEMAGWFKDKKVSFPLGKMVFEKGILTPMVMDFGYKGFTKKDMQGIHYNLRPRKQVIDQTIDLFNGIWDYERTSPFGLFEVYPFLGLNPKNYPLSSEKQDREQSLEQLLDKYFADFARDDDQDTRYLRLAAKRNAFIEQREKKIFDSRDYYFAGVKLYPPLGFNPLPTDAREKARVDYFFRYCEEHSVPIMVHGNKGGFRIDSAENIAVEAGPAPWITVLKNFPGLRICIAHLGGETGSEDSRLLFNELVANSMYKVYTDISCVLISAEQYKAFRKFLSSMSAEAIAKTESRLLFGSDFPMSLLFGAKSYLDYLMSYEHNMDDAEIMRYSNSNSARFVFGDEKSV